MSWNSPFVSRTLVLAGFLAIALPLRAQEKIEVRVVAILASDQGNDVDKCLKDFAKEVQKVRPKLTAFHMARKTDKSIAVKVPTSFPLVDDLEASVEIVHTATSDHGNKIRLKIKPPELGEIEYSITTCAKYFPIITPYKNQDKETLIIAVRAKPCPKDCQDEREEKR